MTNKRFNMFLIELAVVALVATVALVSVWVMHSRRDMDPRADKYSEGNCP